MEAAEVEVMAEAVGSAAVAEEGAAVAEVTSEAAAGGEWIRRPLCHHHPHRHMRRRTCRGPAWQRAIARAFATAVSLVVPLL